MFFLSDWEVASQAAKDADLLILVVARENMADLVEQLKGKVKRTATAVDSRTIRRTDHQEPCANHMLPTAKSWDSGREWLKGSLGLVNFDSC